MKGLKFARLLALMASVVVLATAQSAQSTYLILYKSETVPANAGTVIASAGGTLVAAYDAIGVAVARSSDSGFRAALLKDNRIDNVGATAAAGVQQAIGTSSGPSPTPRAPVDDNEPLFPNQWDMRQIHVPEAHEITSGSRSVLVGVIDTGLDSSHPDLAPNYDAVNSADCSSGIAGPLLPGNDVSGHGTHVAGTIAAARNGIGIIGVAPNVRISGIKSGNDAGFFFPEAVICGFMWAATHDFDVVNNSYFVDPWDFNCRNDAAQRAIWKGVQRAVRYAMQNGVTVVGTAGNFNQDLSKRNTDNISPDFPPGSAVSREVTNACVVIPVEISGVIGVSANGSNLQKSYYSNYGVGVIQVIAPGGDGTFQTPSTPDQNGRILSTVPGGGWGYKQGTSMAAPHVTGVIALAISQFGKMSPGAVQALVTRTADGIPCPDPYPAGVQFPATCQGGKGSNGFNGKGQVNALNAVQKH